MKGNHRKPQFFWAAIVFVALALSNGLWAQAGNGSEGAPRVGAYAPNQLIVKFALNPDDTTSQRSLNEQNSLYALEQLQQSIGVKKSTKLFKHISDSTRDILSSKRHSHTLNTVSAKQSEVGLLENIYLVELPDGVDVISIQKRYQRNPAVVYAEPNYIGKSTGAPNDPFYHSLGSWGQDFDDLWGLKRVNSEAAWKIQRGAGVVVAVIDSGVDIRHPDIEGNTWINTGEIPGNHIDDDGNGYIDDVNGWSAYDDNNQVTDNSGHGTHVAGTIAAIANNSEGVVGVAPEAVIMPVKAFDISNTFYIANVAKGIVYAMQNGASVINNSWIVYQSSNLLMEAVLAADALGVVQVFAAGNDFSNIRDTVPHNMSEAITVSALDAADEPAFFTSYGHPIDVIAPGMDILSFSANKGENEIAQLSPRSVVTPDYLRFSGTSMATPHVAGVAALVRAQRPDFIPAQVKQVLRVSAQKIGNPSQAPYFGQGVLDAEAALKVESVLIADISSPRSWIHANPDTTEVDIMGSAHGDDFSSYELFYSRYVDGEQYGPWYKLGSTQYNPVDNAKLLTWDISGLTAYDYYLRLVVTDTAGRQFEDIQVTRLRLPEDPTQVNVDPDGGNVVSSAIDTGRIALISNNYGLSTSLPYVYDIASGEYIDIDLQSEERRKYYSIDIAGEYVAWHNAATDGSDRRIERYNLHTGKLDTYALPEDAPQYGRSIVLLSNGRVVSPKKINDSIELIAYDFDSKEETQLTQSANIPTSLSNGVNEYDASTEVITYLSQAAEAGRVNLYYQRFGSATRQSIAEDLSRWTPNPRVSGKKIIWINRNNSEFPTMYEFKLFNTETGENTELFKTEDFEREFDFDKNLIVYEKSVFRPVWDGFHSDIFMFDIEKMRGQKVAGHMDRLFYEPKVSNNTVIWRVLRNFLESPVGPDVQYKILE